MCYWTWEQIIVHCIIKFQHFYLLELIFCHLFFFFFYLFIFFSRHPTTPPPSRPTDVESSISLTYLPAKTRTQKKNRFTSTRWLLLSDDFLAHCDITQMSQNFTEESQNEEMKPEQKCQFGCMVKSFKLTTFFLQLFSKLGHLPIHSSQNALLYMEASPKFALYLYQILDGFMGSYRPIKRWKVYIMWQHHEDMTIWGVRVRKSDSHCSMLSVCFWTQSKDLQCGFRTTHISLLIQVVALVTNYVWWYPYGHYCTLHFVEWGFKLLHQAPEPNLGWASEYIMSYMAGTLWSSEIAHELPDVELSSSCSIWILHNMSHTNTLSTHYPVVACMLHMYTFYSAYQPHLKWHICEPD